MQMPARVVEDASVQCVPVSLPTSTYSQQAKFSYTSMVQHVLKPVDQQYVALSCDTDGAYAATYRYEFNGQQKDDEIAGKGNHNTALFWQYDTRLGRWWNLDPVDQISLSNYSTFSNNPIENVDILGDKTFRYNAVKNAEGNTTLQLTGVETIYKYVYSPGRDGTGLTGLHIWKRVEDTDPQYSVTNVRRIFTDNGAYAGWTNYTTTSTYDSYAEAYANRDKPNDWAGPVMVGLANAGHAHREGFAPGAVRSTRGLAKAVDPPAPIIYHPQALKKKDTMSR